MKTEACFNNSSAPSDVTPSDWYTFFLLWSKEINHFRYPNTWYITETDSQQSAQTIISFQTPDNLITRPEISHWESKDMKAVNCIWHFCPVYISIFRTSTPRYGRHFQSTSTTRGTKSEREAASLAIHTLMCLELEGKQICLNHTVVGSDSLRMEIAHLAKLQPWWIWFLIDRYVAQNGSSVNWCICDGMTNVADVKMRKKWEQTIEAVPRKFT